MNLETFVQGVLARISGLLDPTPGDALQLVRFALRVMREAPAAGGLTPAQLVTAFPPLTHALAAVEQVLGGAPWDSQVYRDCTALAAAVVGPARVGATGV